MYKITSEIVKWLYENCNNPDIEELTLESETSLIPKNLNSIGVIDAAYATGSDFLYSVESAFPVFYDDPEFNPELRGYWLYRRDEITPSTEPMMIPRIGFDPTAKEEDTIDVKDCCIKVPSVVEKLTCMKIESLDRLLALEPDLKLCLKKGTYERFSK